MLAARCSERNVRLDAASASLCPLSNLADVGRGRSRPLRPRQISNCSDSSSASSTSMPRYRTVLSSFRWPSSSWTGSQVAGLLVNERHLGPPQAMGAVGDGLEIDERQSARKPAKPPADLPNVGLESGA